MREQANLFKKNLDTIKNYEQMLIFGTIFIGGPFFIKVNFCNSSGVYCVVYMCNLNQLLV